jgi:hypothetical protein
LLRDALRIERGLEMTTGLPAAPAAPLLLLTQTGHFTAAAFLITTAFYAASCAKAAAEKTPQKELVENSPTYAAQNSPTYTAETHPPIQQGYGKGKVVVWGRVGQPELIKLLKVAGWQCWASSVKQNALLLVVADAAARMKASAFSFSQARARLLCPSLPPKIAAADNAPRDALAALVALGVFKVERPGRRYPFARAAEFSFVEEYASRRTFSITLNLTAKQSAKWHSRHERIREGFERKNPHCPRSRRPRGILRAGNGNSCSPSNDCAHKDRFRGAHASAVGITATGVTTHHTPYAG